MHKLQVAHYVHSAYDNKEHYRDAHWPGAHVFDPAKQFICPNTLIFTWIRLMECIFISTALGTDAELEEAGDRNRAAAPDLSPWKDSEGSLLFAEVVPTPVAESSRSCGVPAGSQAQPLDRDVADIQERDALRSAAAQNSSPVAASAVRPGNEHQQSPSLQICDASGSPLRSQRQEGVHTSSGLDLGGPVPRGADDSQQDSGPGAMQGLLVSGSQSLDEQRNRIANGTDCSEAANDGLRSQGCLLETSAQNSGGSQPASGGGQAAIGGSHGADEGTEGRAEDLATGAAVASGELPGSREGNVAEGTNVLESQRAGESLLRLTQILAVIISRPVGQGACKTSLIQHAVNKAVRCKTRKLMETQT